MSDDNHSNKVGIWATVIGGICTVIGGLFTNWDKIFPTAPVVVDTIKNQSAGDTVKADFCQVIKELGEDIVYNFDKSKLTKKSENDSETFYFCKYVIDDIYSPIICYSHTDGWKANLDLYSDEDPEMANQIFIKYEQLLDGCMPGRRTQDTTGNSVTDFYTAGHYMVQLDNGGDYVSLSIETKE